MFNIPKKVESRISDTLKKYQPIIQSACTRDINETDTVTIIKDFFSDCFGYDKYSELTSEFAIRGTYCDLAIRIDNEVKLLVEVKAPGVSLKENQIKQAVDYSSNSGIEWVILTNSVQWMLYKLEFKKPIEAHLVCEFNILDLNPKKSDAIQNLYILSKEGMAKSALEDFYGNTKATNRYLLSAIILGDSSLSLIKRELKRLHKDVKIDDESLISLITGEVIKRDIIDSNELLEASKEVKKAQKINLRKTKAKGLPQKVS